MLLQLNITRLASPYTSACYSDWAVDTNYTKYVPTSNGTTNKGWGYTLPVRHTVDSVNTITYTVHNGTK